MKKDKIEHNFNRLFTNRIDKLSVNSIDFFHKSIQANYLRTNKKVLKYLIHNLLHLKDKMNNKYIFDASNYLEYIHVNKNKEIIDINNDIKYLESKDRILANKQYSKVKYIEHFNKDKISAFITLTCPSEYHYFTANKKGKNPKCVFDTLGESIEQSFLIQKKLNRELYKNFKKQLTRKKISCSFDFVKMLEQHNKQFNLTIHSHSMLFLTHEQFNILNEVYNKLINKYNLEQTKLIILNKAKSCNYVLKYIIKNIKENKKDNYYNEIKRYYSNHKFFTCSNYKHTTQEVIDKVYNYLKFSKQKLYKRFKKSNIPLYVNIEKYIKKYTKINYKTIKINKTNYKSTIKRADRLIKKAKNPLKISRKSSISTLKISYIYTKLNTKNIYKKLLKKSIKYDIKYHTKTINKKVVKSIIHVKNNQYIYKSNSNYIDKSKINIFKKQGIL